MAGRARNHKGKPKQLGHPGYGMCRRLTSNESIAADMPRSALVFGATEGSFILMISVGRYEWQLVPFEERPDAYTELSRFWGAIK